jgi:hypothetical protein
MLELKKWSVAGALLAQHGKNANRNAAMIARRAVSRGLSDDARFWRDIMRKIAVLQASKRTKH